MQKSRRHQSGQSLVEVALSIVILLMLVSGIIDLGRAFYVKVALESMISEGAHWAADYPGCVPSANNSTAAPQVPVQCRGNNSVVGRMCNETLDLDRTRITDLSITPLVAHEGDDIVISVTYQMPTVTPIIQFLFGSTFELRAQVREVVRGSDTGPGNLPPTNGTAMASPCGVPPVYPIDDLAQLYCTWGKPTLHWTAVSATGYHLWRSDQTSASPLPAADITSQDPVLLTGGIPGQDYQFTDDGAGSQDISTLPGGDQFYTATAYNTAGAVTTDAVPVSSIIAHCAPIAPGPLQQPAACKPSSVLLAWTPQTNPDHAIDGYTLFDSSDAPMTHFPNRDTQQGEFTFTTSGDRTKTYYIQAYNGSNWMTGIGTRTNTISLAGVNTCNPAVYAELTINNTSPATVTAGTPFDFTVTVTNTANPTGPVTATGVTVVNTLSGSALAGATITASGPGTTCTVSGATVNCTPFSLGNGLTETITIHVVPTATGNITDAAQITATTSQEYNTADNGPVSSTTSVAAPSATTLQITKNGPGGNVGAGTTVTFTIIVTNIGSANATGITITDPPVTGLTLTTVSGACTAFPCNPPDLLPSASLTITANYTVSPSGPGTIINTATVTSPSDSVSHSAPFTIHVTAGRIQNFHISSCSKAGSTYTYVWAWDPYSWPNVDHFIITDVSNSLTRSTGAGTGGVTTYIWISSSGSMRSDYFHITAYDSSGNPLTTSQSSPDKRPRDSGCS